MTNSRATDRFMDSIALSEGRRTTLSARTEGELPRVFIEPFGLTAEIDEGATLLVAVSRAGVGVPVDCGGRGTCGKCLVKLGAGDLTSPTEAEFRKIPAERLEDGWRLACQARPLTPNVSVEVRRACEP